MITWAQWGLQDAISPVMEEFIFFHDFTLIVLSFITVFVIFIIIKTLFNKLLRLNLLEGQIIECIWTLLPAVVLVQVAVPSLILLYILDEAYRSQVSLKVIGHQWFWSYEYSDHWRDTPMVEFDSYIIGGEPRVPGCDYPHASIFRLLDVDNRTTLPFRVSIRIVVRSADVLHSWTVPSLGVKVDAAPGRLNQLNFLRYRPGLYFGQCSEICGANHRFMPIRVEFIAPLDYFWWVRNS